MNPALPPHLSLNLNLTQGTSFKRSFEEFGIVDQETEDNGREDLQYGHNDGDDERRKRARQDSGDHTHAHNHNRTTSSNRLRHNNSNGRTDDYFAFGASTSSASAARSGSSSSSGGSTFSSPSSLGEPTSVTNTITGGPQAPPLVLPPLNFSVSPFDSSAEDDDDDNEDEQEEVLPVPAPARMMIPPRIPTPNLDSTPLELEGNTPSDEGSSVYYTPPNLPPLNLEPSTSSLGVIRVIPTPGIDATAGVTANDAETHEERSESEREGGTQSDPRPTGERRRNEIEEHFRLTLERFNAFEEEIDILRRSPAPATHSLPPSLRLNLPLSTPPTPRILQAPLLPEILPTPPIDDLPTIPLIEDIPISEPLPIILPDVDVEAQQEQPNLANDEAESEPSDPQPNPATSSNDPLPTQTADDILEDYRYAVSLAIAEEGQLFDGPHPLLPAAQVDDAVQNDEEDDDDDNESYAELVGSRDDLDIEMGLGAGGRGEDEDEDESDMEGDWVLEDDEDDEEEQEDEDPEAFFDRVLNPRIRRSSTPLRLRFPRRDRAMDAAEEGGMLLTTRGFSPVMGTETLQNRRRRAGSLTLSFGSDDEDDEEEEVVSEVVAGSEQLEAGLVSQDEGRRNQAPSRDDSPYLDFQVNLPDDFGLDAGPSNSGSGSAGRSAAEIRRASFQQTILNPEPDSPYLGFGVSLPAEFGLGASSGPSAGPAGREATTEARATSFRRIPLNPDLGPWERETDSLSRERRELADPLRVLREVEAGRRRMREHMETVTRLRRENAEETQRWNREMEMIMGQTERRLRLPSLHAPLVSPLPSPGGILSGSGSGSLAGSSNPYRTVPVHHAQSNPPSPPPSVPAPASSPAFGNSTSRYAHVPLIGYPDLPPSLRPAPAPSPVSGHSASNLPGSLLSDLPLFAQVRSATSAPAPTPRSASPVLGASALTASQLFPAPPPQSLPAAAHRHTYDPVRTSGDSIRWVQMALDAEDARTSGSSAASTSTAARNGLGSASTAMRGSSHHAGALNTQQPNMTRGDGSNTRMSQGQVASRIDAATGRPAVERNPSPVSNQRGGRTMLPALSAWTRPSENSYNLPGNFRVQDTTTRRYPPGRTQLPPIGASAERILQHSSQRDTNTATATSTTNTLAPHQAILGALDGTYGFASPSSWWYSGEEPGAVRPSGPIMGSGRHEIRQPPRVQEYPPAGTRHRSSRTHDGTYVPASATRGRVVAPASSGALRLGTYIPSPTTATSPYAPVSETRNANASATTTAPAPTPSSSTYVPASATGVGLRITESVAPTPTPAPGDQARSSANDAMDVDEVDEYRMVVDRAFEGVGDSVDVQDDIEMDSEGEDGPAITQDSTRTNAVRQRILAATRNQRPGMNDRSSLRDQVATQTHAALSGALPISRREPIPSTSSTHVSGGTRSSAVATHLNNPTVSTGDQAPPHVRLGEAIARSAAHSGRVLRTSDEASRHPPTYGSRPSDLQTYLRRREDILNDMDRARLQAERIRDVQERLERIRGRHPLGSDNATSSTPTGSTTNQESRNEGSGTGRNSTATPPVRMNPDSYAPGPFRNTIQRMVDAENARRRHAPQGSSTDHIPRSLQQPSNPAPMIPPLDFESNGRYPPIPRIRPPAPRMPYVDFSEDIPVIEDDYENDIADLHSALSRQPRIPESRIANTTTVESDSEDEALNVLLRHDGPNTHRSRELVNRFRRIRAQLSTSNAQNSTADLSSNRHWGTIEPRTTAYPRPPGTRVPPPQSRYLPASDTWPSQLQQDRDVEFRHLRHLNRLRQRAFLGDYMRDDDLDLSYENLLDLGNAIGEARPRGANAAVIDSFESGLYRDWQTADSDQRCPICLEDYKPEDKLLKLNDCTHWLHDECLKQWLKGAKTCPVCRKAVSNRPRGDNSSNNQDDNEPGPSRRPAGPHIIYRRGPPGPHHHHHHHHHHPRRPT